ncbi:mannose-1-phosphate guanylyltransferase [Haliangium ochraceum]|uniref:Mannose-1-phosphate guanylyltransferase n=1 Tax=Haliangium ochraceum (strain DSM 14365 / JCM 11303 / SMP-2) TaxID=502025 RepID=D0LVH5_HALO1|nr:sugar phosphate nucleotidyltransferase [Haliangium ochraceum]ACY17536.1 Mannose-1-phosphate guanylyltransferase [Haliangium ochraceum DSM 14365]
MRYAVVLAGGSGNRLWPASRKRRPKQFLSLGEHPGESLLAATLRRIAPLCAPEYTLVVTAEAQAEQVRAALPSLPRDNLLAEPSPRNTAAALGLAATYVRERDPEAVIAALPADLFIADPAGFARVAERAFAAAAAHEAIVTIAVPPTRAEPGFGYLRLGAPIVDTTTKDGAAARDAGADAARQAARDADEEPATDLFAVEGFVEKPDPARARAFVADGQHLWNAGMFFARARHLLGAFERYLPATHAGLATVAAALRVGGPAAAAEAARSVYPVLPAISFDHGVLEHTRALLAVRGDFGWNDVGSWSSLAALRADEADPAGNVVQGRAVLHEAHDNVVFCDSEHVISLIGVQGLVVVQSGDGILIVPRERAQDVREVASALERRALDRHL